MGTPGKTSAARWRFLVVAMASLFALALGGCYRGDPTLPTVRGPEPSASADAPSGGTSAADPGSQLGATPGAQGSQSAQSAQSSQNTEGSHQSGDATELPWNLTLVNQWNPVPEGFTPALTALDGQYAADTRIIEAAQQMIADCKEAGNSPVVVSAYRSEAQQAQLLRESMDSLMAGGMSEQDAREEALKSLAEPGASEHQLGLALDIVDESNQTLTDAQADTATSQWLREHCWEYGFILRYPEGKSDVTGIIYEPWHFRYVGVEPAQAMRDSGQVLEEYLETLI